MQLELDLRAPAPPDLAEVARLTGWLYEAGDRWCNAREISSQLGISDRQIRHLAAASRGLVVSGPGCPGYKHVRHCDPEEAKTVAGRLRHQAKLMDNRASEILRAFHEAAH